jgi:hypothetical protein
MKFNKIEFTSFLFSLCASIDLLSFMGFRVSLIPMVIYGIALIIKNKTMDKNIFIVVLFFLSCAPSVIFSYAVGKSVGYLVWILFNFLFISYVFKHLAQEDYFSTLKGIFNSYRFQIVCGAIFYFAHLQDRAHFLYYEPSYFAIALIPYVVIFLSNFIQKDKKIKIPKAAALDVFLCILAIYTTKSANLLLVFLIGSCVISLHGKNKLLKISITIFIMIAGFVGMYFYSKVSNDLISITFKNIFMSGDILDGLRDRVGNRWYRVEMAYKISLDHFWGVGIGAYREYTLVDQGAYPFYSSLPWYLNPLGLPAIDLYVEMTATCGWLALVIWLFWHYRLLFSVETKLFKGTVVYFSLLISMLILIIESSFMRPYYWILIGICMAHNQLTYNKINKTANEENPEG